MRAGRVIAVTLALWAAAPGARADGGREVGRRVAASPRRSQTQAKRLERQFGVDVLGVRPVASGLMLRFDYRVVDPARAHPLMDRKARALLVDEETRTALAVPALENVGELRQIAPLQARRTYFVVFGNPGRVVRRGSRVTVSIGAFRAEGLRVQ